MASLHDISPSIRHLIETAAERGPDSAAIAAPGRRPLAYRGLCDQLRRVATDLDAMGIGREDRVAVALPGGPEAAVAVIGVACRAVAAPLDPALRAAEFESCLGDIEPCALLVHSGTDSPAREAARRRDIPVIELLPVRDGESGLFTLDGARRRSMWRDDAPGTEDVALLLHTSGTTSRPKRVPLTHANICAAARSIQTALQLNAEDRCLNVMPLFHIHGLVGAVLSSLSAGASVFCPPGFYAPEFFDWIEEFRPTWYTAVPAVHRAVLARAKTPGETVARSSLRFIRSCSAPLPPRLASELEETFGVPVVDSYGMTEASHQIASTPLGKRRPGSVGVAAGPEIAIMDEAGNQLPAGEDGEIAIRGANVIEGYEGTPEINRQAFTEGWLRTGDLGHLDGDGYLYITGRLKEIINRAGEKISPAEVEEALLAHPAVKEAVVFALPHPELGEEVGAAVVLRDNAAVSAGELRRFAAERLADFKLPTRIVFVPSIPAGPTGKIERLRLAERLGVVAAAMDGPTVYVAPRTPLENQLADLWSEVLVVARVGIHDDFFALGGDSVLAAQLLNRVRKVLHGEISFLSLFEAPTIAAMAGLLATAPAVESAALPRAPETAAPPLSYGQERMWFLDQLAPGNPAYNRPAFYRLDGALDAGALEKSLQEIVARHEVLRTAFPLAQGQPLQVVSSGQAPTLRLVDLKKLPEARRRTEAERLAAAEATRPFDLAQGPLLRATLLRLSAAEHVLLVTAHHIVFDGWSEAVFLRELTVLYDAFARGAPSPLPALPIQYLDYAVWQRRRLEGRLLQDQLSYWKRQLAGAAVLDLPADRPRPAAQTFRGARKSVVLPKALCDGLKAFSRRQGATLFMTLLAAFQTLLHRYTGQDDIVVGSPIAGRARPELEGLIGVFINTLVFRGDLSGDPSFRDLLARARKTALEAYERQDLPFEKLVEELRPERDPGRTPLFQVMFVLENTPQAALEFPGVAASPFEVDSGTAKLDLSVSVEEAEGALKAVFEYNTDLFEHGTMDRMMGHFETLLQGIVADPGRRLSQLTILTDAERRRTLVEWNDTKKDYPKDHCVHELFEEQAERMPDAIALAFPAAGQERGKDQQLTYGELNRRANQLAHYLKKRGVGPEALVGVCVERSCDMIVGLLGILKAGGAYVPLDPDYPAERLAFMLGDAGLHTVLTQQKLIERLRLHGAPAVCLDADRDAIERESEKNLLRAATPDNLVYVIYTSGSTGRPKGVQIAHRGLVNYLCVLCDEFGLGAGDRVLQFSSISFDSSAEEIFHCLARGATLVLRTDAMMLSSARAFLENCGEWGLTMLPLSTAYWHELAAALSAGEAVLPERVRFVHIGGERILPERVAEWLKSAGEGVRLVNGYGPTEVTVVAAMRDIDGTDGSGISSREISIGRPIANTQVYILDRYLEPVPVGVPGELHIGGAGLARGYLNSPELTAEKFIPDPFSDETGARLYRTGDRARYLPDGDIEFLGRVDNQIKIRGFRVELEEIEAVLRQHPGVHEAVVAARAEVENLKSDKRLAAYVVSNPAQAPAVSELREFVKARLPDYMVPSAFVMIDALPLTPNGKIDRRALPAPDHGRPELDSVFVAPRSPIEERLANIWAQVLGLERVGVHDNFFDLSGHSLLATQVISRVREAYRIELSLRAIFETPTVAGIARVIQGEYNGAEVPAPPDFTLPARKIAGEETGTGAGRGAIKREREPDIYERSNLTKNQLLFWLGQKLQPEVPLYNVAMTFTLSGSLDRDRFRKAFQTLLDSSDALRTVIEEIDGVPRQKVLERLPYEMEYLDFSASPKPHAALENWIEDRWRAPVDFRARLFDSALIKIAADQFVWYLKQHHIVTDGWSMHLAYRRVSEFYARSAAGRPEEAAALPRFQDYVRRQREESFSTRRREAEAYWKKKLADKPGPLKIDGATRANGFERITLDLGRERTRKLKDLAARPDIAGATEHQSMFVIFAVALFAYLHRITGSPRLSIGAPFHNRGSRGASKELLGLVMEVLPLQITVDEDDSFLSLIQKTYDEMTEVRRFGGVALGNPFYDKHYDVLLNYYTTSYVKFHGMPVRVERLHTARENDALTLWVGDLEGTGSLAVSFDFHRDVFGEEERRRGARYFLGILDALAEDPGRSLRSVSLLSDEERQRLLCDWNDTKKDYPRNKCVHELFEEQVERTPDAVAAVFANRQLTYSQLNRRANCLARHLKSLGVGPGTPVGICVERSLEMIVGLLAILKAGGAYVAINPEYPGERWAFMLAETGAALLLTQQALADRFFEFEGRTLCLDRDRWLWEKEKEENPGAAASPDHPAYIMYTSGSTGKPKGVVIRHAGVVNYFFFLRETYRLDGASTVLQLAPFSFDASVRDLIAPLTMGARVVIVDEFASKDPAALLSAMRQHRVTCLLSLVPTMLNAVLDAASGQARLETVRLVVISGEALSGGSCRKAREVFGPGAAIVNQYGPTESTMTCSYHRVTETDWDRGVVPLGRPIPNLRLYILDRHLDPASLGVHGELHVGGVGVALGYLDSPDLTAEKFIPDPFSDEPGARLYKTGDLARRMPDGNIEFLGRIDHQVKVRGFRIELEEIEAALARHPALRQAIVVASEDAPGGNRLVAYVVPGAGRAPAAGELRNFLKTKLPEYMVPSAFVVLDALPLTANRKVDRRALPAPDRGRPELKNTFVAPRNALETTLAAIWAQVLGLEQVGVHDNFFDLGGHSLLATQVISRVREARQVEVNLRTFFERPTVAGIAEVIERAKGSDAESATPKIPRVSRQSQP